MRILHQATLMRCACAASIVWMLSVFGCSSNPAEPQQKATDKEYLALGWSDYEGGRYDSAVNNFTQAYNGSSTPAVRTEALSGRGWSYAQKRNLQMAKGDFTFDLGIAGITPDVRNDVRVGNAFVLYALNDFAGSDSLASAALADNPTYVFSHDPKVTTKRVRLLLAQSYFASGQFALAAGQLDIIDAVHAPHSSDPASLLATITAALNSL